MADESGELARHIQDELALELSMRAIHVDVDDNNVYLSGAVPDRTVYEQAMQTARRLAGGRVVQDQDLVVKAQPMDLS